MGIMHHVIAVVRIAASAAAIISLLHQRHPISIGSGDPQQQPEAASAVLRLCSVLLLLRSCLSAAVAEILHILQL